jgi:UDP-N-acetylmuramoyl-L-alanyl-D-glutamate--2,6-diaminopimelate ligase
LIVGAGVVPAWRGPDPVITSVVEDSREVTPGACFVAMRGAQTDGHAYVEQAVRAGAAAVMSERPLPLPGSVAGLSLRNARAMSGRLAAVLYGLDQAQRDGRLRVVGITGTNGKSTFCFLLRAILRHAGRPTALLGTIEYDLLGRTLSADLTTPTAPVLMSHLAEAFRAGATHAVMEVSSIALDQGRTEGVRFGVGVFSNLSRDHLDHHGDMEQYLLAKKRLFNGLDRSAVAVINADDPAAGRMTADCQARIIRYGIEDRGLRIADRLTASPTGLRVLQTGRPLRSGQRARTPSALRLNDSGSADHNSQSTIAPIAGNTLLAEIQELTAAGTRFALRLAGPDVSAESCEVATSFLGRHNVYNCLSAAAAAVALGVSLGDAVEGLATVSAVPGRLQRVRRAGPAISDSREDVPLNPKSEIGNRESEITVLVDYAHTEDALENVLSALRPLTRGRLIVLFGCGGKRDAGKRPRMAQAVGRWADVIVVTSDNPRTEDPDRIIDDILGGFSREQRERALVEPDRRAAIAQAVGMAEPGDVVLLAGKGHENYQLIGNERIAFDDAVVAGEALAARTV